MTFDEALKKSRYVKHSNGYGIDYYYISDIGFEYSIRENEIENIDDKIIKFINSNYFNEYEKLVQNKKIKILLLTKQKI